jgi:hypothetical protein
MPPVIEPLRVPDGTPFTDETLAGWLARWCEVSLSASGDWLAPGKVWTCDGCGCLFIPYTDDVVFLDRYQQAGGDCQTRSCTCHDLPKRIPWGTGTVTWYHADAWHGWTCGSPPQWDRSRACDRCDRPAVVFLNLPEAAPPAFSGPTWLCATHAGVTVPEFPPPDDSSCEPLEFAQARAALETLLALQ